MTYKQFFNEIANYWGQYERAGVAIKTMAYLKDRKKGVSEQFLDILLGRLMRTVSTKYNHVPDIADMYQAKTELAKEEAFRFRQNELVNDVPQIAEIDDAGRAEIDLKFNDLNAKLKWRE